MAHPFAERPALCGPLRQPRQMLADQTYDGHKSIHDDAMAADLGLRAGPIEGPTHFSQFDPLLVQLWGRAWYETGCISAHYQTMVVEGEQVRAFVQLPEDGGTFTRIWAEKADGTPVLTGTASVGAGPHPPSEISQRIAKLRPPQQLVINRDLRVGQQGAGNPESVRMAFGQHMGPHYPFSLADKLKVITEPCPWYTPEGGGAGPLPSRRAPLGGRQWPGAAAWGPMERNHPAHRQAAATAAAGDQPRSARGPAGRRQS